MACEGRASTKTRPRRPLRAFASTLRLEGATVASFLLMPTLMRGIELSDINYVQTNERFEKTTFQRIQQMKKRGFWSQVGDIVITIALMLFVFDLIDVLTGGKKE